MAYRITQRFLGQALCAIACLALAGPANAQVPVNPSKQVFSLDDANFAAITSVGTEFYQCASLNAQNVCQGRASSPFQASTATPKASIQTLTPPVQGANRLIDLTIQPPGGVLRALPAGVPFVTVMTATAPTSTDPTQISGTSARSGDSNAFFASGKVPAAPAAVQMIQ